MIGTKQRSIGWLMGLVSFLAIGLTIARGGPEVDWLARYWFVLVMTVMAASWFWFLFAPLKSLRIARGNRDRQRLLLEWVVNTPGPASMKVPARFSLAVNYQITRRYAEAEALFRLILQANEGALERGVESHVRQHLADTLEALGRSRDAERERERAAKVLPREDNKFVSHQAQGQLLDRAGRYAEAIKAFERALSAAPPYHHGVRTTLMMQLILSSNNAGKPADTVRWAEALIALDPRGTHSDGARRMAAIGYTGLGRFGDAERHLRTAIEQASFPEKRAEALAQLGQLALSQGRLDEAESHARAAESLRPGKVQLPWLVIGQVAKARGRLEQAVQALEHACTIDLSHIPAQNRRGRAAIHRELATLHAELGRGDVALALIAEAEIELAGDRIEEIILDAAAALVHAFRRERGLATARIDAACDGRMPEIEDQTSRQVMLILVIRARLLIGDIAQAESLLHELLAVGLAPPSYPFAYYHLAECRRRAGDEEGAREFDSKAASTQFGTRWEQLARQRLAAESITRS